MGENETEFSWDADLASRLFGKLILVGLSYIDKHGELIEHKQIFGRVAAADQNSGIKLKLEGNRAGSSFTIPPDTSIICVADRGEYHLHSTDEIVVDPDYTAVWSISSSPEE